MKYLRILLVLLCTIVHCHAAMAEDVEVDGLKYALDDSAMTATVMQSVGKTDDSSTYSGDIFVPSTVTYNDVTYNVTAIGEKAFRNSNITSVVISEGITSLGELSFSDCRKLKRVSLPEGLKTLGSSCFGNCYALESIAFPEGITELPGNCCVSNHALTEVSLPESLTTLGEGCFGYCGSLRNVVIPDKVISFGRNCFLGVSLTTMVCYPTTPPDAPNSTFFPTPNSVEILYVPEESIERYKASSLCQDVKEVRPIPRHAELGIPQSVTVGVGQAILLRIASPFDTSIEWTSSDENVVKVAKDGTLTGVSLGTTTVTATSIYNRGETTTTEVSVIAENVEHKVSAIRLSEAEASVEHGSSLVLKTDIAPIYAEDPSVSWSSSDTRVATVIDGKVTALAIGTADITATANDGSGVAATCHVTVTPILVYSLQFEQEEMSISLDETTQLKLNTDPTNHDETISYSSSDENVAVVTIGGLVMGVGYGTAKIVATTNYSHRSDAITIKVIGAVPVASISVTPSAVTLKEGQTKQLTATVLPENASEQSLAWSSSDTDIVTVDENGLCTAVRYGTAAITAKATDGSGVSASCIITVESIPVTELSLSEANHTLPQGERFQLVPAIQPSDASNKMLDWTTTNANVASVDADGNVTGVGQGKAIITAKTTDGSNLTANCIVTVTAPSGIEGTYVDEADGSVYYSLDGIKLQGKPQKEGVYIRNTDSKSEKVVVKRK